MNLCTRATGRDDFHVVPIAKTEDISNWARRGSSSCRNTAVWQSWLVFLLTIAVAGPLITGCSLFSGSRKEAKAEIKSIQIKSDKSGRTISGLQAEVRRFADDYAATVAQASDDFSSSDITNETFRISALKWKLDQATAAYIDASGRNPIMNSLDLVVLASLSRMVVESLIASGRLPEAAQGVLREHKRLETNAWNLVQGVLKPEQKEELEGLIRQWRLHHQDQRYVAGIRFREFASGLGENPDAAARPKPTSVFNLLFIDPMAGLDPTARAIQETRQSADSITYYAQRAPFLLAWQVELLTYELGNQPNTRQVLADAGRLSKSAETFAQVANHLPEVIEKQREAAIKQILEGIATERSNFVASLASQEASTRTVLTDARETLQAGTQMASALNETVRSLHAFTASFSTGAGSNAAPPSPETPKKPFNILDYGQTAQQVSAMALQMNTLLTSATQATPQLKQLGGETREQAQEFAHHVFWLALILIMAAVVFVLVGCLSYRFLVLRWTARIRPNQAVQQSRIDLKA